MTEPSREEINHCNETWSEAIASIREIRLSEKINVHEARDLFLRKHGCSNMDEYLIKNKVVVRCVRSTVDPTEYKYIT